MHDSYRTSAADSDITAWERDTWPELEKLARNFPEAGIHFQGSFGFIFVYFLHRPHAGFLPYFFLKRENLWAEIFMVWTHIVLIYYERERDENQKKAQLWYKDFVRDVCIYVLMAPCEPHIHAP